MNKKEFIKIARFFVIFAFIAIVLGYPAITFGQTPTPAQANNFTLINPVYAPDIPTLLNNIATFLLGIVLALGVIVIIWAGLLYVTAGGEEEKIKKAKQAIIWAIVGVTLALLAKGLVMVIQDVLSGGAGNNNGGGEETAVGCYLHNKFTDEWELAAQYPDTLACSDDCLAVLAQNTAWADDFRCTSITDEQSGSPTPNQSTPTPGSNNQGQKLGCFDPNGLFINAQCFPMDQQTLCDSVCEAFSGFQSGSKCKPVSSASCPNP